MVKPGKDNEIANQELNQVRLGLVYTAYYIAIFSFFINLLMLAAPIYMLQVYDRVISSRSQETLIYITIMAVTAIFVYALLEIVRGYIMIRVANWVGNRLNGPALLPVADEIILGRTYGAQCLRDINQIKQFLGSASTFSFFDAPWTPLYLLAVFMLHPILGWISTIGGVIIVFLAILNEKVSRKPITDSASIASLNNKRLEIATRNADVIRAFGMMETLIKIWREDNFKADTLASIAKRRSTIISFTTRFVRFVMQILMLGAGAHLVIQAEITAGMMIASSIIMSRALAPIEQMIGLWNGLILTQQAYAKLKEHLYNANYPTNSVSLPKPKGMLQVNNATYNIIETHKTIVKHVDFMLAPGKLLAVMGASGSGKTTLAKLIVGVLRPTLGNIRLDGAEIYDWDRSDIGKHIGYLPQNIEFFPDTIARNISRLQDVPDTEVIQAAKLAGVHQLILTLSDGYDTVYGDGCNLSGGQLQRIGLARALFGDPALIVLDEPNSNLDIEGEYRLSKILKQLKGMKKTVVIIAHRPQVIEIADNLLILDKGEVMLYGKKEEVLRKLRHEEAKNAKN